MRQNDDGKTVSAMDMLVPRVCMHCSCYRDLGNFGALSLPCVGPFCLEGNKNHKCGKMNKCSLRALYFVVFPLWDIILPI